MARGGRIILRSGHVNVPVAIFVGQKAEDEMSDYVGQLDYEARKRYFSKLEIDGGKFPDPYSIQEDQWIDDAEKWPDLEYGDIYNYLIDTPGPYTKENLRAYKSLEAYNFFYSGHVRTVLYYEISSTSSHVFLSAKVNPSQKSASNPHEAWVLMKRSGLIATGHCTCMAG